MKKCQNLRINYGKMITVVTDNRRFIVEASGLSNVLDIENIDEKIVGTHLSELQRRVEKNAVYNDCAAGFAKTLKEKTRKKRRFIKNV